LKSPESIRDRQQQWVDYLCKQFSDYLIQSNNSINSTLKKTDASIEQTL
jgi:hypothetical protein